jgi:hypothetical protein
MELKVVVVRWVPVNEIGRCAIGVKEEPESDG